jgi:cytochrome c553
LLAWWRLAPPRSPARPPPRKRRRQRGAYPVNPPGFKPAPDDGTARQVPDSKASYTLTQLRDRFLAPNWHPGDYPPMPEIVAQGRKPDVYACGFCHRADGPGGPENANLTGLPKPYIVRQLADFKHGTRKSSVQDRDPMRLKEHLAKAVTDAEIDAAATYFASIKPRSNVRVVESATAPQSVVSAWFYVAVPNGAQEPIGQRIVEVPENTAQFVNRDTRARFVAYVPEGSIKRGQVLATTGGGGRTLPCGTCHGDPAMRGVAPIGLPPLAELHGAPALRHQAWRTKRQPGRDHEVDRQQSHDRRHDRAGRLYGIARAIKLADR